MSFEYSSIRTALLACSMLVIAGCASSSLTVVDTPAQQHAAETARVTQAEGSVVLDRNATEKFGVEMRKHLYREGHFAEGDDLVISYRFIQLDKGNKAARYFVGFGVGRGTLTVEVSFRTRDGTDLGRIHTGGEISAGILGGDFDEAVTRAAKEAADFAINGFLATN